MVRADPSVLVVGLICVVIQASWLLLRGVLSCFFFFLKLHNLMVTYVELIGLTRCSTSCSAGLLGTPVRQLLD